MLVEIRLVFEKRPDTFGYSENPLSVRYIRQEVRE
jgi:hypothetical protein